MKQGGLEDTPQQPPTDSMAATSPQNAISGYNISHLSTLNNVPLFIGDPILWQPFWDSFDATINSNRVISNVQKLNCLRAQL